MLGQCVFHPEMILHCTTPRKNLPSTCATDLVWFISISSTTYFNLIQLRASSHQISKFLKSRITQKLEMTPRAYLLKKLKFIPGNANRGCGGILKYPPSPKNFENTYPLKILGKIFEKREKLRNLG